MEYQELKEIDHEAQHFIASAYQLGMSVLLIDRFLRESNYDCTMSKIHQTLWARNVFPDNYNCSSDSLIWRRYLTNILEKFEVSTLEQFEQLALEEAIDYYDIDNDTFTQYWNDFNEFTREIKFPLDPDWIVRAIHYFGFTINNLSKKLRKRNIISTPSGLYDIYISKAQNHIFSSGELKLRPKTHASNDLREFWRFSHKVGKDIDTIVEWTEVFTGTNTSAIEINLHINDSRFP